jgi:hypothetical protein
MKLLKNDTEFDEYKKMLDKEVGKTCLHDFAPEKYPCKVLSRLHFCLNEFSHLFFYESYDQCPCCGRISMKWALPEPDAGTLGDES